MLKIKDNVDLKELEKYGFKKEEVGLIRYYFDYPNTITIIDINTRIIENNHDVCFGERAPKDEILLEDLIKNNIVEEEK